MCILISCTEKDIWHSFSDFKMEFQTFQHINNTLVELKHLC